MPIKFTACRNLLWRKFVQATFGFLIPAWPFSLLLCGGFVFIPFSLGFTFRGACRWLRFSAGIVAAGRPMLLLGTTMAFPLFDLATAYCHIFLQSIGFTGFRMKKAAPHSKLLSITYSLSSPDITAVITTVERNRLWLLLLPICM